MIPAFQSALSGLQAFSTRLQSNANNVANINTEGFKRTRVLHGDRPAGGVKSVAETVNTPGHAHYQETADGSVLLELSNVDLATELPDMKLASTLFKANIKTMQTADEMLGSLLNIKV